jgi:hypothetical protein
MFNQSKVLEIQLTFTSAALVVLKNHCLSLRRSTFAPERHDKPSGLTLIILL